MAADGAPPAEVTREAVLAAARGMATGGLVAGTAGNVSGRLADGTVCATPASLPYDTMEVADLVVVDLDGTVVDGSRPPTSELLLHLACYRAFPEVGGVVHAHPVHASAFAVVGRPVPAVIEEAVLFVGGDVPVCGFRPTGTAALGEEACRHLADRGAALLANHGLVAVGTDPADALHVATVVERVAHVAWAAIALGDAVPVPDEASATLAAAYLDRRRGRSA
jgi:L-fuculose-phosphate aldolase